MTCQAARPPVTAAARGIRRVLPLSAGMFVLGLDAYVLSDVLGNISGDLHVTVAAAGQMVTAFTLSYALLSPVLATVSGSWPRRRVLLGAMALFTAANVVSALAPTLAVLIAARVVAGAAAGLFAPTAGATAGALVAPELRARALALSLGGLISATVIGVPSAPRSGRTSDGASLCSSSSPSARPPRR
jgi:predicted MFS family arabinose efflux permease